MKWTTLCKGCGVVIDQDIDSHLKPYCPMCRKVSQDFHRPTQAQDDESSEHPSTLERSP